MKNVQSKFKTWKYKVVRIKQEEQVNKIKKIEFYRTVLRELKSVVIINNPYTSDNVKRILNQYTSDHVKKKIAPKKSRHICWK